VPNQDMGTAVNVINEQNPAGLVCSAPGWEDER
jgi:hypothetical protein